MRNYEDFVFKRVFFMAREKSRVKFYSKYDMSVGFYIRRVANIIENFNAEIEITDINEIIELYNIQLFISNEIYPTHWDEQQRKNYTETTNFFQKQLVYFFLKLTLIYWTNFLRFWNMIIGMIFGNLLRSIMSTKKSLIRCLLNCFQVKNSI